jgi:hypothetical protein
MGFHFGAIEMFSAASKYLIAPASHASCKSSPRIGNKENASVTLRNLRQQITEGAEANDQQLSVWLLAAVEKSSL